jgi:adenylate cyclase
MGEQEKSDDLLQEVIDQFGQEFPYMVAWGLAYRDETDRAFEYLDKAYEAQDSHLQGILLNPGFAPLYDDPRWLPLLERLGKSPEKLDAIIFDITLPE